MGIARTAHGALKRVDNLIMQRPVNYIVEADIKGFFDHVDHDKLIEMLRKRFNDGSLLFLIRRFLKAGYVDKGVLVRSDEGTPQGSILSPVLANVYLHS